jgi:hypothetical protein
LTKLVITTGSNNNSFIVFTIMLLQTVTSTTQDESEVSAMPKQLYEQHTQYRYWLFSPEELNLMRNKHNERAHQRIMANWQQEWASMP